MILKTVRNIGRSLKVFFWRGKTSKKLFFSYWEGQGSKWVCTKKSESMYAELGGVYTSLLNKPQLKHPLPWGVWGSSPGYSLK